MEHEEVFVKFVGADEVVEHILPLQEKKSSVSQTKKRTSSMKPIDFQTEEETVVEFCEESEAKHRNCANGLVANVNEVRGSDVYSFKTPRKSILIKREKDFETPRRTSKVFFSLDSQTPKSLSSETPRPTLKKTPSVRLKDANATDSKTRALTPKCQASEVPRKTPRRLWKRNAEDQSSDSDSSNSSDGDGENDDCSPESTSTKIETNSLASKKETPSVKKTPQSRRKLNMDEVGTPRSRKKRNMNEEVSEKMSAENYFETHHSSKSLTSDRTLSRLEVPHLEPSEIIESLAKVTFLYEDDRSKLCQRHANMYSHWMFSMCQGFNILLHGLGSKMKLLEGFRQKFLSEFSHVVVNGFFPGLTLKSVLSAISESVIGNAAVPMSPADQLDHVKKIFQDQSYPDFFLIIHNIDGVALRNEKAQQTLSFLSQIEGFHIIASVDHINCPLLWDLTKSSRMNWLWFEATTYEGYVEETSYENSLMVKQSGTLALSSLTHIMKSLTPNAKGMFLLVVKYQLDKKDEAGYQGIAFPDLYQRCREAFLVNSEQTLRAQLVEFRDHKLVKTKSGADGVEYVIITLDESTLTTFVEQHENQS